MTAAIDISGQRFGKLLVVDRVGRNSRGQVQWRAKCDCGGEVVALTGAFRSGQRKSCKCGLSNPQHGRWHTRLHRVWSSMKRRCYAQDHVAFARYGGRGIQVCPEWHDFATFAAWADANGYADDLEIDRIDNNGGYKPDNCRFVDRETNANNRSSSTKHDFNGELLTLAQASRKYGRSAGGLKARIAKGMTPTQAVTQPWLR